MIPYILIGFGIAFLTRIFDGVPMPLFMWLSFMFLWPLVIFWIIIMWLVDVLSCIEI